MTQDALICLEQVTAVYDAVGSDESTTALKAVSLSVQAGEWVAILGANGSGKSTLIKLICGVLLPTHGTVTVAGLNTKARESLPAIRRQLGMVWQQPDDQLVASVVEEEVAFGLEIRQIERTAMMRMVERALRAADLWEQRNRAPYTLSGGQRQRLVVAAALAPEPRCLVLDEATSRIDEAGKVELLTWLKREQTRGMAIVTVTHDMREAAAADRVIVLSEGQVVATGTPREVFALAAAQLRLWGLTLPFLADVSLKLQELHPTFPAPLLNAQEFFLEYDLSQVSLGGEHTTACIGREATAHTADEADELGELSREESPDLALLLHDVAYTHQLGTPFARLALRDVHLQVHAGERIAVIGHTGSGKSTLLQILGGLLQPDQGLVRIGGLDPRARDKHVKLRQTVGLLFQNPEEQLFERYVGDDIAFGPLRQGLALAPARERVRAAMAAVGLPFAWKDRLIDTLSGGQKRKVGIAGVLALDPDILILDEPTSGLDPLAAEELLLYLRDYQMARKVTVVIVTHQLAEAAQFAERIVVMAAGQLLAQGVQPQDLSPQLMKSWGFPAPDFVQLTAGLQERGVQVCTTATAEQVAIAVSAVWSGCESQQTETRQTVLARQAHDGSELL